MRTADPDAAFGHTDGNDVEYAHQVTKRSSTRTVSGIPWYDAQAPSRPVPAFWTEQAGEKDGTSRAEGQNKPGRSTEQAEQKHGTHAGRLDPIRLKCPSRL